MLHETENLRLDSDGYVFVVELDEDGERDFRCLGDVENCAYRVPDELEDEFSEVERAWEQAGRDWNDYEAGVEMAWRRAKGF